jgi:hypothetical protein
MDIVAGGGVVVVVVVVVVAVVAGRVGRVRLRVRLRVSLRVRLGLRLRVSLRRLVRVMVMIMGAAREIESTIVYIYSRKRTHPGCSALILQPYPCSPFANAHKLT